MKGTRFGLMGSVLGLLVVFAPATGRAAVVDFLAFTLNPSSPYFDASVAPMGEFSVDLVPTGGFQLFSMQSSDLATAVTGVYTSLVQTGTALTSDGSSGGMVSGTFDSQSAGGAISTLTLSGAFLGGFAFGSIAAPEVLLIAEASGPAVISEFIEVVPDDGGDQMQYQQPMRVVGGELFDGANTGLTMLGNFTITYTLANTTVLGAFPPANAIVDDLSQSLAYSQESSNVLMNPEPVSVLLLGIGAGLALRRRRRC